MTATLPQVMIPVAGETAVRPVKAGDAIRLYGSTSGFVGFKPAAAAGSTVWELPVVDGTVGQFLKTDGAGTLSFATVSTDITIDTTAITGGGANRILFESATGKVSESANLTFGTTNTGLKVTAGSATTIGAIIQGAAAHTANLTEWQDSAGAVKMAVPSDGSGLSSPVAGNTLSLTTRNGADSFTSSWTIDANGALTASTAFGSTVAFGGSYDASFPSAAAWRADAAGFALIAGGLHADSTAMIRWTSTLWHGSIDLGITRHAAGILALTDGGAATDATPVASTLIGQSGLGTDIAGAALNLAGGKGTGTGVGGSVKIQTAPGDAGSGTTLNDLSATVIEAGANATVGTLGFYGATPVALQTGVAVSAAGIHAALVNLGLITA